jgi:hypothetical protein
MTLVMLLLLLAVIFGGVGLFAMGVRWLLVVAAVFLVASGAGYGSYHRHPL